MQTTIIVAIIGGFCTILSPILTLLFKSYLENRQFISLSANRRKAIYGLWKGKTIQNRGPQGQPIEAELTLNLMPKKRLVKGEAEVRWQQITMRINVEGGFYNDFFIRLNYHSADEAQLNFGVLFLKLSANSKILKGKLIGYGSESEALIDGETVLNKV